MTRGGAALWYRDFAAGELDVLELLTPEEYLPAARGAPRAAGDLKQLRWDPLDRELVDLARERLGDVAVVHPGWMFTRLRGLWFKGELGRRALAAGSSTVSSRSSRDPARPAGATTSR